MYVCTHVEHVLTLCLNTVHNSIFLCTYVLYTCLWPRHGDETVDYCRLRCICIGSTEHGIRCITNLPHFLILYRFTNLLIQCTVSSRCRIHTYVRTYLPCRIHSRKYVHAKFSEICRNLCHDNGGNQCSVSISFIRVLLYIIYCATAVTYLHCRGCLPLPDMTRAFHPIQ